MPGQTPSQTVGPFFSHALTPQDGDGNPVAGNRLADGDTAGTPIRIEGRVADGAGDPVADAMIEIWQADHGGRYPDGSGRFRGFGRTATDDHGRFEFRTVKPGRTGGREAPYIWVTVFARGMLNHLFTRLYFSDETEANAGDPLLGSLATHLRDTLIAKLTDAGSEATYEFHIRLRGDCETVFLDV